MSSLVASDFVLEDQGMGVRNLRARVSGCEVILSDEEGVNPPCVGGSFLVGVVPEVPGANSEVFLVEPGDHYDPEFGAELASLVLARFLAGERS